jgi:hypothetical protein
MSDDTKYRLGIPEYEAVSIRNITELWEELSATVFWVSLAKEVCFSGHKKEMVR